MRARPLWSGGRTIALQCQSPWQTQVAGCALCAVCDTVCGQSRRQVDHEKLRRLHLGDRRGTLPLSARRGDTARACPAWHDPIVLLGPHCCARRGDTASMPRLDATTKAAQRSARATFASRGSAASCGAIMIGCRARARRSTDRCHPRSSGVSKSN